jgi:hypothetical protein
MATKVIQLFITLEEIISLIKTLVSDMQLKVFLYRGESQKEFKEITEVTSESVENYQATKIFLALSEITIDQIDPDNISAAKLGLVQINLPVISDQTLMISDIAIKTDWYEGLLKYDNKDLVALFKKIKLFIVKNTKSPVLAKNIVTGAEQLYPDIRYTEQAKNFYDLGGELMQKGLNNVRFEI